MIPVEDPQIGAADAGTKDLDKNVGSPNLGYRHIFHAEIVRTMVYGC